MKVHDYNHSPIPKKTKIKKIKRINNSRIESNKYNIWGAKSEEVESWK